MPVRNIGQSISEGQLTLRERLEKHARVLESLVLDDHDVRRSLVASAQYYVKRGTEMQIAACFSLVNDFLMQEAPILSFFGVHPKDPHSYGFWPDFAEIEQNETHKNLIRVGNATEVPSSFTGQYVLVVKDAQYILYNVPPGTVIWKTLPQNIAIFCGVSDE